MVSSQNSLNKKTIESESDSTYDTASDVSEYDTDSIIDSTVIYSSSDSEEDSEEDVGKILTDWVLHDEQGISPWNTHSFEE